MNPGPTMLTNGFSGWSLAVVVFSPSAYIDITLTDIARLMFLLPRARRQEAVAPKTTSDRAARAGCTVTDFYRLSSEGEIGALRVGTYWFAQNR